MARVGHKWAAGTRGGAGGGGRVLGAASRSRRRKKKIWFCTKNRPLLVGGCRAPGSRADQTGRQGWAANPASRGDAGLQAACNEALTALLPMEDFQAYPGARLMNAIKERVAAGDAMGTARLVQRVSSALMSRSYRSDAGEWESEDDATARSA